ncbi:MAG: 2-C-methyl-D-erythritol 2,4-cyclodiphosphate synthase [Phycisphaerales bacterium]|nr:2-C-methyl-D-erythritol 2,4-cyclodiphosphate synthase [Phycisphaerales bacterium]
MHDADQPIVRIGHGYDLHRLEPVAPNGPGRPFVLGGIRIDHPRGPVGHSDGDPVCHAVVDALMGAIGGPDIGQLFPDNDPRWDGQDSEVFVAESVRRLHEAGYRLGNMDITLVCERPKVSPHKDAILANLARMLGCDRDRLNLKGKTHERVDAVGEERAVEVHVVALVHRGAEPE